MGSLFETLFAARSDPLFTRLGQSATWVHDDASETITVILTQESSAVDASELEAVSIATLEPTALCRDAVKVGDTLAIGGITYYVDSVPPPVAGIYRAVLSI